MHTRCIKYPLKFKPIFKQTIWGGNRFAEFMSGLDTSVVDMPAGVSIGECWGISVVPGYESVVLNGDYKGERFSELVALHAQSLLGRRSVSIFGNEFPLLVKFIDAAKDLSVQVHPNDMLARSRHNCNGKTEMWYVVDAAEGASLSTGFRCNISKEEFEKLSGREIVGLLEKFEIKQGDMFYLPAGTVHSIGAGAFIAEIQQSSDITYRIYDYDRRDASGRTRELHTQLALDAIDFDVKGLQCRIGYKAKKYQSSNLWNCAAEVVKGEIFSTSVIELDAVQSGIGVYDFNYEHLESFVIFTCMEGKADIRYNESSNVSIARGEVVLLPAELGKVTVVLPSGGKCKFLETHI